MCAAVYRQRHLVNATEVTAGLAESNGSLLLGLWRDSLHVTCGLTACTPVHQDQLRAQRSVTSMGKLYLFYLLQCRSLYTKTTNKEKYHSRQFSSSAQSPQVLRPSQTSDARIQRSLLGQLNTCGALHCSAIQNHTESHTKSCHNISCITVFVSHPIRE